MTIKNLFIFAAIVAFGFGIALLLMPIPLLKMYAAAPFEPSGILSSVARGYGTILTGLGVGLITSINAEASTGRKGLLWIITVTNILAVTLHITVILQGIENQFAWTLVATTGLLALWGGYLLSKEKVGVHLEVS